MDWIAVLAEEARQSDIILADQWAAKYAVDPGTVSKVLSRCARRGLVERVTHKIYVNKLVPDFVPQDLVNVLRPNSYISLESALWFWGISTQTTALPTCVTTGKPRNFRGKSFAVSYRSIAPRLFSGFIEKHTRYTKYRIAEPEKALLGGLRGHLRGVKLRLCGCPPQALESRLPSVFLNPIEGRTSPAESLTPLRGSTIIAL